MTTLLLRADAGPSIGVGHLSRCVAFAEAARARGWRVRLSGSVSAAPWLAERLAELDVPVLPGGSGKDLAELAAAADIVLVDHYGLGTDLHPALRGVAALVSIEDGAFGRRPADVVVDANLVQGRRPPDGSTLVLRGPDYAPLRQAVRAGRERRTGRPHHPPRVVVVLGGGDQREAVHAVLTALRDTGLPMEVTAISTGAAAPDPLPGQRFTLRPPTPDLPDLLAGADLVVSAAGVTLLELCCIGVPMVLVRLADNQAAGYRAAVDRGLAAGIGTGLDPASATAVLRRLLSEPDSRATLAEAAADTVDGLGADRVLDVAVTVTARPATESDAERLLAWRNDADTRRWSRDSTPVAMADHLSWLPVVLGSADRLLLVLEHFGRPLGTVRFDRVAGRDWEVSITVAAEHRGHGWAVPMLLAAERELTARHPAEAVLANVHRDNAASSTLFARAGYVQHPDRRPDGPFGWLAKPVSRSGHR